MKDRETAAQRKEMDTLFKAVRCLRAPIVLFIEEILINSKLYLFIFLFSNTSGKKSDFFCNNAVAACLQNKFYRTKNGDFF